MAENDYDWAAILANSVGPGAKLETDVPQYFRTCLEVFKSDGKGLGLRTNLPASAGELLLVERAFVCGKAEDVLATALGRLTSTGPQAAPRVLRAQVCALVGSQEDDHRIPLSGGKPVSLDSWGDDLPVWDLDKTEIENRLKKNSMAIMTLQERVLGDLVPQQAEGSYMALYPITSLINHDCSPNCNRLPVGSFVVVRAARDLLAGEELTVYYNDIRSPRSVRGSELQRKWGFVCRCRRCEFESNLPSRVTKHLELCHSAWLKMRRAGAIAEEDLRSQVQNARASTRGFRGSQEQKAWLLTCAFVLIADELANNLLLSGGNEEAETVFEEIQSAYAQSLPCSLQQTVIAHWQSVAYYRGRARKAHDNPDLLCMFQKTVELYNACYGCGVRVWHVMTRKTLPATVYKFVASKIPHEKVEKLASAVHFVNTIVHEKGFQAELQLPSRPNNDSLEVSALAIRIGAQIWSLPFEIRMATAQTSWLCKKKILRLKAELIEWPLELIHSATKSGDGDNKGDNCNNVVGIGTLNMNSID
eukprot:gnl/MRDRNA2_/MRDRNA2_74118_c0_seq1.p1 gnl/MRDRNA2_/MRDRNA2_74118_c0~~gnl/MRDRNA2_/MRDRNA2_74118_c0_seq1.p1  ORF type:complete len:549 (-),score=82.75 gnl/MRDRNA2_/MRDRNA2_74118_c0_seq1:479-2074(-)